MTLEAYYTVITYVMAGVFGLCIGSFLNVVIYRVPLGMSIAFPASHCPRCGMSIRWYDNVPVLSYLLLGGKCRGCRVPISPRYTIVELANALLWLACVWVFRQDSLLMAALAAITMSLLICVFFIDLEHMIILDRFQLMLAAVAVAVIFVDPSALSGGTRWWSHLIGAAAGFGVFCLIALLGRRMFGREALGGGDVKLAAVMGLWLGWQKLLLAVLLASVAGSVVLLILQAVRKEKDSGREYPFAPFLTAGFALAILCGDGIIGWYMALLA